MPKSDVPFDPDQLNSGDGPVTDTHGKEIDTNRNVGRLNGGIPVVPKYTVMKSDGTEVDANAEYFVIRVDTDSDGRDALLFYASRVKEINPKLAVDLRNLVEQYS